MSSWLNNTEACLIFPGVYISNYQSSVNAPYLSSKLGVTCVVSLSLVRKSAKELEAYKQHGIEAIELGISDMPGASCIETFLCVTEHISRVLSLKGTILVHCDQGVSRSPSAVIMYLMRYDGHSFQKARTIVSVARRQAFPNEGFMRALQKWRPADSTLPRAAPQPPASAVPTEVAPAAAVAVREPEPICVGLAAGCECSHCMASALA
jgi:hypothetical protein